MIRHEQTRTSGSNHPWRSRVVPVPLTHTERLFMIYRLQNIPGVAGQLAGCPRVHDTFGTWDVDQFRARVRTVLEALLRKDCLLIVDKQTRAVVREAIEGNTYFADMAEGDPRYCRAALAVVDRLRAKIEAAIGVAVARPAGTRRNGTRH